MSKVVLSCTGVSKRFVRYLLPVQRLQDRLLFYKKHRQNWSVTAVKDVHLAVKTGEWIGITGPNGSGKTTLLRLLAGLMKPDQGTVQRQGSVASFFGLGAGFNSESTADENITIHGLLHGLVPAEIDDIRDEIIRFAGLQTHRHLPIKCYSTGMRQRLAFAAAMHVDADIYLFDEVLAVGDPDFQRKCRRFFDRLKAEGKTVVMVGQSVSAMEDYCERIFTMRDGKLSQLQPALPAAGRTQKKVLGIVGMSHSGSSLLNLLLHTQPGVYGLGAAHHVYGLATSQVNLSCNCHEKKEDCPFFSAVDTDNFYEDCFSRLDCDVLVDGSKYFHFLAQAIRRKFDTHILMLSKAPHEFAHSKYVRFDEQDVQQWFQTYATVYRNFLTDTQASHLPVHTVQYARLATSPAEVIAEICDACGVEFTADALEEWTQTEDHILVANAVMQGQLWQDEYFFSQPDKYNGQMGQIFLDTAWQQDATFLRQALLAYDKYADQLDPVLAQLGQPDVASLRKIVESALEKHMTLAAASL